MSAFEASLWLLLHVFNTVFHVCFFLSLKRIFVHPVNFTVKCLEYHAEWDV